MPFTSISPTNMPSSTTVTRQPEQPSTLRSLKACKGDNPVPKVDNKTVAQLSAPAIVHTRSRSSPVDSSPSGLAINSEGRPRNHSGGNPHRQSSAQPSTASATAGNKTRSEKTFSDPFAFVSSELARAQDYDGLGAQQPQVSNSKLSMASRSTSQNSSQQRQTTSQHQTVRQSRRAVPARAEDPRTVPSRSEEVCNPLYELSNCSREAGKPYVVIDSSDDSTQDTYEMDVSSSPVY